MRTRTRDSRSSRFKGAAGDVVAGIVAAVVVAALMNCFCFVFSACVVQLAAALSFGLDPGPSVGRPEAFCTWGLKGGLMITYPFKKALFLL